ncbi:murinoglobulin-2-like [Watersipora subatra]|uniref:murinoglobulin-2-like n=1 Tax=Watersipora subatra TaxID=2589382 RepID=UPI00355C3CDF
MRAYRGTPYSATGETADMLMLGRELRLPDQLESYPPPTEFFPAHEHALEVQRRLQTVHEALRQSQMEVRQEDREKPPLYAPGDWGQFSIQSEGRLKPYHACPERLGQAPATLELRRGLNMKGARHSRPEKRREEARVDPVPIMPPTNWEARKPLGSSVEANPVPLQEVLREPKSNPEDTGTASTPETSSELVRHNPRPARTTRRPDRYENGVCYSMESPANDPESLSAEHSLTPDALSLLENLDDACDASLPELSVSVTRSLKEAEEALSAPKPVGLAANQGDRECGKATAEAGSSCPGAAASDTDVEDLNRTLTGEEEVCHVATVGSLPRNSSYEGPIRIRRSRLKLVDLEPGYLVSAPNRFIQNRPETVCIDLYNVAVATQIQISLRTVWIDRSRRPLAEGTRNLTVDTATTTIQPGDKTNCLSLTLPVFESNSRPEYVILEVSGRPATGNPAGYYFSDSMKIAILSRWYNTDITFIQTDKPIYKPGQLVRVRILTLDSRLRPSNDMIDLITIETPSKVRVEQWNNLTVSNGMVQLEFQLHEEPDMGYYTIKMKRNGKDNQQRFEVKEYVLPKYEVTVEPPRYVTFQTERVVAKVCAKYTFGQPVLGVIESSICVYEQQNYYFTRSEASLDGAPGSNPNTDGTNEGSYCTLVEEPLVDGCYTVNVSRQDVGYDRYSTYQYSVRLVIETRVKEQGTGDYLDAETQTLYFQRYDIQLKLEGPDRFKPGLSYNAKMTATKLDGRPSPGEPVDIELQNCCSRGRYIKRYIADANGEIKFSIPPAPQDFSYYSIRAEATRFNSTFWRWRLPNAVLYVKGWYSPSGSFLQIVPNTQTLSCGSPATFKIQYTTSIALETQLQYKVVGLTDIVDYGSSSISLTLNTAVTEQDEQDDWDHTPRDSYYYYWWRSCDVTIDSVVSGTPPERDTSTTTTVAPPTTTHGTQVTATHKGTFYITVPVTAAMSTSGKLVVYYIRPDGEVVADGVTFKVEECTENEAQMRFSKSDARPGEPVDLLFSASPNSFCSYGVVDKSVFLEGGDNQLSLSKALDKIQRLALQEWSGVYESELSKCGSVPTNGEWLVLFIPIH